MSRRRVLLIALAVFALAIAGATSAVRWLCYSQDGLLWLAGQTTRLKTMKIRIEGLRGTLAGPIELDRIEIDHERAHVVMTDIEARLRLRSLWLKTLLADEVRIGTADVTLKRKTSPNIPRPPRFLPITWLSVRAREVTLGATRVTLQNGQQLYAAHSLISATLSSRALRLEGVRLANEQLSCKGSGELRAADPMGISAALACSAQLPEQPRYAGQFTVEGDLNRLNLTGSVSEPVLANVRGTALDLLAQWRWEGRIAAGAVELKPWLPESQLGKFAMNFSAGGNARRLFASGRITPQQLPTGPMDVSLDGAFAARRLQADRLELAFAPMAQGGTRGRFTGSGYFLFDGGPPTVELRGKWVNLGWPLQGQPMVVSRSGELTLQGPLPYAYTANGSLAGPNLPAATFGARGSFDKDSVMVEQLIAQLNALPAKTADVRSLAKKDTVSTVAAMGSLSWRADKPWSLKADIKHLNPAAFHGAFPGDLDAAVSARGNGFDPKGVWTATLDHLRGRLRNQQVTGNGKVGHDAQGWQLDDVRLTYGSALLETNGRYGATSNLQWRMVADDLSKVLPEARGRVNFSGRLSGSEETPKLSADLQASKLEYRDYRLTNVTGAADLDPKDRAASQLQLSMSGLGLKERTVRSVQLSLDGQTGAHDVQLVVDTQGLNLTMTAKGAYEAKRIQWRGEITKVAIDAGEAKMALQAPVPVVAGKNEIAVEPFCLVGDPERACGNAHWRLNGPWSAKFEASALPLKLLTAGLAPSATYSGELAIDAAAAAEAGRPWTGNVKLDFSDGVFSYLRGSGKEERVSLGSGRAELAAEAERFTALVDLKATDIAEIKGDAVVERRARAAVPASVVNAPADVPPVNAAPASKTGTAVSANANAKAAEWRSYPLTGSLQARTKELSFLSLVVPEIDRATGDLQAAMTLGGVLGAPRLEGSLTLKNGELDLYAVNLLLREVGFQVDLKGNTLRLDASARAGEGKAQVTGEMAWKNGLPKGSVRLKGENLLIANVPEAQVRASPNIGVNIDGRHIEVDGAVRVPYARLAPANLSGAVLSSEDEVIVGTRPVDPTKRFHVTTGIHLILGDDVRVDSNGLSGRLTGGIAAFTETGEVSTGTGELRIVENNDNIKGGESKYNAYGRELDIQRGRLVFTGGVLSNPGVDIRAVKKVAEVTAGVNVRGTLRDPKVSFFSDPPLPQNQIASLLVAGRTFDSLQNGSGPGMNRDQLLAQGGALLAQQLGSQIGIDDVSVESNAGSDSTSLVLGKYLSPRLYVGYGISLAEAINTLKLRYTLGDRWTIKLEAGEARSADVVYAIDK